MIDRELTSARRAPSPADPGPTTQPTSAETARPLTDAEQRTVEQNLPLVHYIVSRLTERFPANRSRDDLVQVGALGLIEATRRFEPGRDVSFSTYAGRRIEGAILDALRSDDWASRSVRSSERRLLAVSDMLYAALGRQPTDHEICESMHVEVKKLHALRADLAQAQIESLNRGLDAAGEQAATIQIDIPSAAADHDSLERQEMLGYLRDAIRLLPERHRLIVVGHFIDGKTITELGDLLGVTQSRVSQLKSEALTMMRNGMASALGEEHGSEQPKADTTQDRQRQYNDALKSASDWRQRLTAASGQTSGSSVRP